jgi:hypothetical protein
VVARQHRILNPFERFAWGLKSPHLLK